MGWIVPSGGTVRWEQGGDVPPSLQPLQRSDQAAQSDEWPQGPRVSGDTGSSQGKLVHVRSAVAGTSAEAMPRGGPAAPGHRRSWRALPVAPRWSRSRSPPPRLSHLVAFCPNSVLLLSVTEAAGYRQGLNIEELQHFQQDKD